MLRAIRSVHIRQKTSIVCASLLHICIPTEASRLTGGLLEFSDSFLQHGIHNSAKARLKLGVQNIGSFHYEFVTTAKIIVSSQTKKCSKIHL